MNPRTTSVASATDTPSQDAPPRTVRFGIGRPVSVEVPEPRPIAAAPAEDAADRAFITPRIVDQRTFDELAGELRELMRAAGQQRTGLAQAAAEVTQAGGQLRQATKDLHTRLENAAKLLPALDTRVARAESTLDAATRELAARVAQVKELTSREVVVDAERIHTKVDEIAHARIEEMAAAAAERLHASIERTIGEALDRVRAAAGEAADRAELAAANADNSRRLLESAVEAAELRVRHMLDKVGEAAATIAASENRIDEAAARAEERAARARAEADETIRTAFAASSGLTDDAARCEARLVHVRAAAEEHLTLVGRAVEDLSHAHQRAEQTLAAVVQHKVTMVDLENHAREVVRASGPAAAELARARAVGDKLAALVEHAVRIGEGLHRLTAKTAAPANGSQNDAAV